MITDSVDARRRFGGSSRPARSDSDSSTSRRDRDSNVSGGITRSGIPFFFVGSSGDKIELVYDLPDTGSFTHDGDNYDIGFKYNAKKAYGVTLMSDKKNGTFVLYHRKKYIPYDDKAKELVIHQLGSDPSVAFRTKLNAMPDSQPLPGSANDASGSFGFGWMGFILLAGFLYMMKNTIIGVFAAARNLFEPSGTPDKSAHDPNNLSVDDRISARLAEMRNENLAPGASTGSYPVAAPSGFGRKSF